MSDKNTLNQQITDKLIIRLIYEIKTLSKDKSIPDYKFSEKFKKILEEEIKWFLNLFPYITFDNLRM